MTDTGTSPSVWTLAPAGAPRAIAVVAHGGRANSTAPASRAGRPALRMYPFTLGLHRGGRRAGLVVAQLRYRVVGYNDGDPVADVEWAISELRGRFGELPVCLVGHSMGARACVRAAGADGVVAVAGLAPWLTPEDPVAQVAGRTVMLAHGVRDRITDPARSRAWAELAHPVAARLCRFEVAGTGHAMLERFGLWQRLVRSFTLGALELAPLGDELSAAFAAPAQRAARIPL
jgi:predicted esterase